MTKRHIKNIIIASGVAAILATASFTSYAGPGDGSRLPTSQPTSSLPGSSMNTTTLSFDPAKFRLPEGAKVLVVVEGFKLGGDKETYREGYVEDTSRYNSVRVTAFYRDSDSSAWTAKVQSAGVMGWSGMSNKRYVGSGMTPIGVFKMNTPFGRQPALEGFPSNYTQIDMTARNQYWSDSTNTLSTSAKFSGQIGEKLWSSPYDTIYDYCIDSGFNVGGVNDDGAALFLHCTKAGKPSTAGCVAIDTQAMIAIEKLYALGDTYIAIAPESRFGGIYGSYNATGKSAEGTFTNSTKEMGTVPTIIID